MKNGFIHVAFVIDESGSMYTSMSDVINGFNKMLDDQKKVENGSCAVTLYTFNGEVTKHYVMEELQNIRPMKEGNMRLLATKAGWVKKRDSDVYCPFGSTAMNDGIGTAIDEIGKVLADMPEEERPEKNMIVIMTDGHENSSKRYQLPEIKEKIKHQEEKYDWSFIYMGTDITSSEDAKSLGIKTRCYNTREDLITTINSISSVTSNYRNLKGSTMLKTKAMSDSLNSMSLDLNSNYIKKTGIKDL